MSENLEKIKKLIERALADGVLSRAETEMIRQAIYEDKKVTPEEMKLWRELQKRISDGEILIN
ncbi:MAG: hypothetical protein NZ901_00395 [Geminocystis sp.]|nr:hypothetical protein [Geminocystis sp.]HIK36557.1 hypothetical protein [Geminocystis sp. M7585_C2015_104]MCS7146627.1 hypothetical protein [Geminocystis sp.]MCX8077224.1 hypothetical protein [Geminocystis sp.]MDW8115453.1 hypothetical protein [Geminocystis sp.]